MSSIKWIKLSTNMFEDEKIKLIEQMPDADTILIIWVKLLAQAGKTNASGYIYLSENIPYTDEMLATIFNRPVSTVRLALRTFEQFGMIEIDEEQYIAISNWEKHQNVEGMERIRIQTRERVRRHRERKQLELTGDTNKKCAYCGKESDTIDHIVPISKGGEDVQGNIVDCCKSCNSSKSNKSLVEFLNDSFRYRHQDVDHAWVRRNEKLMQHVEFDGEKYTEKPCNASVTLRNATEEELEEDKEEERDKEKIPYVEIVKYLNEKTDSRFKHTTKDTQTKIRARWNEGFRLEDFKNVIDIKTEQWLGSERWKGYLRPFTLFSGKFEGYLNEYRIAQEKGGGKDGVTRKHAERDTGESLPSITGGQVGRIGKRKKV